MEEDMPLGPQKWQQHRTFYDNLTLEDDGDDNEQYGARTHGMHVQFSNYEHFWRHYVAPSTQRPADRSAFRAETAEEVILLTQRNYTVFVYLLEAHEYRDMVLARGPGPRFRNWYNCVTYAGNALQVFTKLQDAIEQNLAAKLARKVDLFPDWKQQWNPGRESVINFRNYLTHQGYFQVFLKPDGGGFVPHVLHRSQITRDELTWIKTVADFQNNPQQFMPLNDAAREIVTDTTAWLNNAYGRILQVLQGLPENATLQQLWGWKHGLSPVPVPVAVPAAAPPLQLGGQTIIRIPPSPNEPVISGTRIVPAGSGIQVVPVNTNLCATTSPPPKPGTGSP
ncbi:MAG: hypothetical protein GXY83_05345 [Rhodopirellula sp.]|nr:hypothetical protein [Rhodopirellula sp.]